MLIITLCEYLFTGSRLFGLSLKIPPYQPARVGCIPSAPGRSFSHGLVASLPLLGSAASLVAKADMQDSAQPGALQDSEASKFEELELQAEE